MSIKSFNTDVYKVYSIYPIVTVLFYLSL